MYVRVLITCFADQRDDSDVVVVAAAPAGADGYGVCGGDGEHDVGGGPLHGRIHSGRKRNELVNVDRLSKYENVIGLCMGYTCRA